jgi:uncharacterized protein YueI
VIENCCWLVSKDKSKENEKKEKNLNQLEKKVQHYLMNIKKELNLEVILIEVQKRLKELKMDYLIVSEEEMNSFVS